MFTRSKKILVALFVVSGIVIIFIFNTNYKSHKNQDVHVEIEPIEENISIDIDVEKKVEQPKIIQQKQQAENKEKKVYVLFNTIVNGYSISLVSYNNINNDKLDKIDILSMLSVSTNMTYPFSIQVDKEIINHAYELFFQIKTHDEKTILENARILSSIADENISNVLNFTIYDDYVDIQLYHLDKKQVKIDDIRLVHDFNISEVRMPGQFIFSKNSTKHINF